MKQKRFLLLTLVTLIIQCMCISFIVYKYDPFFHFHKPNPNYSYKLKESLHSYINPGIAKNFEYDTIILGSSMTRAFEPSYIEDVTGEQCVKLSIPSAYGKDIKDMFDTAVSSGQLKHVILAVDAFAYAVDKDLEANEKPTYLFNENPLDDVAYTLNKTVLFEYIPKLKEDTKAGLSSTTMDEYQNYARLNQFGRERALRRVQYMYFQDVYEEKEADYYLKRGAMENVEQNLVSMIEEHPDIQFDLFIPPYSILKWYNYHKSKEDVPYLGVYQYIASQIIPYENVSLYFYQGETDVITNLDNYMDTMHPSEAVNRSIVQYINDKDNRMTMETFEIEFDAFQSFIDSYDYDSLIKEAWSLPTET